MIGFPKPIKGAALLERRERSASRRSNEQKIMQQAKRRDGNVCRIPRCEYRTKDLPIDCCHMRHRGAGGNPSGDRTVTPLLFAACRIHHGLYDRGELDVQPQTDRGADGPMDWLMPNPITGRMEVFASEKSIGVSVERGR